jgi:hypothetical protein
MNELALTSAGWRVIGHFSASPLAADWREQLALRLGQPPRRIGLWAELALYGARHCLDLAGEDTLPADALLRVASFVGPRRAIRESVRQFSANTLLPFSFLQSLPNQMLAGLSQYLDWQGDACLMLHSDPAALLRLARHECGPAGVLIGWVDEGGDAESDAPSPMSTEWLRLLPSDWA